MRQRDIRRFGTPYSGDYEGGHLAALEIDLPHWNRLKQSIVESLSDEAPYGIPWIRAEGDERCRILIGDQLISCVLSVTVNLTEAVLHYIELLDYAERDSERLKNAVQMGPHGPTASIPPPRNALDEIIPAMIDLHIAGAVRSAASTLDCLAGTMIGVQPLTLDILKADFGRTRRKLRELAHETNSAGTHVKNLHCILETGIEKAGPAGWIDWVIDFRNMLVHRGRRIFFSELQPDVSSIYGPSGRLMARTRSVIHLPRRPALSEVEALEKDRESWMLGESAPRTIQGIIGSLKTLIELTGETLLNRLRERERADGSVSQPREQWPNRDYSNSTDFAGYDPRSKPPSLENIVGVVHPVTARRIVSAFRGIQQSDGAFERKQ